MQRAVAAALLAEGVSVLSRPGFCDDSRTALEAARGLGAEITASDQAVTIRGGFSPRVDRIDCGEAGLSLRMFSPIAALSSRAITFHAQGSLRNRPAGMIEATLRQLGCRCSTCAGFPPVRVQGPLQGGDAEVDGAVSSQFLTGLLIALPRAENSSRLQVRELKSKPYIDLTIEVLEQFGIHIHHERHAIFDLKGGQSFQAAAITVEGDWSSAAFLLVAGAIAGKVTVRGLSENSLQADRRILEALDACGARMKSTAEGIQVEGERLRGFTFDATDCPDLFPPLAALACHCRGKTRIEGVHRLAHKESRRAEALLQELGRLGAKLQIEGDRLEIDGTRLEGGEVDSHGDHRIAMAAAIAGLQASGPVHIRGSNCVAKSYPQFFDDLQLLGGTIDE